MTNFFCKLFKLSLNTCVCLYYILYNKPLITKITRSLFFAFTYFNKYVVIFTVALLSKKVRVGEKELCLLHSSSLFIKFNTKSCTYILLQTDVVIHDAQGGGENNCIYSNSGDRVIPNNYSL